MQRLRLLSTLGGEWPYWAGGLAIALVNTAILALEGRPWGITSLLTNAGSRAVQWLGFNPERWSYYLSPSREQSLSQFGWWDGSLWLNLGVVAGVLLASWGSGEWRVRGVRSWRKAALALGGGLLMGYGARLALGCNAGALLGGIPSLSLHGWIFAGATFIGVVSGIRLFRHLL